MTDQKPTDVFVRLPLSNEQIGKLLAPIGTLNERMLAIGTPVTGGGLKSCAWVRFFNYDQAVSFKFSETAGHEPVVLRSDAQAKIAALEAEIVRLHGVLTEIAQSDDTDNALDPERNKQGARAALKGGAA